MVLAATGLFWASRDYAVTAPDWDGQVRGIAYNPSHVFTIKGNDNVSAEQIDRDLRQLSTITGHVRTYTVDGGMDKVPEIARHYGMTVSLGIWISPDLDKNEQQLALGIKTALANRRTIDRVIVGNETQFFGYVSTDQLNAYILRVRQALPARIKVTTAEPWSTWLLYPEAGKNVDVVFVHLLPYWEMTDIRGAIRSTDNFYNNVQKEFPNKPIIIGEVGWPSDGNTRGHAVASLANEAYFIRAFIEHAVEKGYDYYIMEAYDGPWKAGLEGGGGVGAYWGLFDATGHPKFAFTGLLRNFPQWRFYALLAAFLTLALGLLVLGRMPRVRQTGYLVMGGLIALVSTGLLALIDATALVYIDPTDVVAMVVLSPLVLLACAIILTEGIELAASLWRVDRRVVQVAIPVQSLRVSVHIPTYNEPPAMVIETLNALARLDYDNFEVIVLDNNTPDPEIWRPVEAHCAKLGFRFFHFDGITGFKAGALNRALALTDPTASHIAVIDSDYQVFPYWLRRAMPFFAAPKVAIVQGPQDYRDAEENIFKAMAYQEYRGFFHIGMVERNEHNAIIQHGTMTIVSRAVLEQLGGWAEWCITEDTELGLRIFESGFDAAYIPQTMGSGVEPDTLEAFMSQRYRWVYGAMQIMKRHARPIFLGSASLTWTQRYQFLSGWLPWISDGLGMVVTITALIWTALMWAIPGTVDVPMPALSAAAMALFATKMLKTLLLYPPKVRSGIKGAAMASLAGLALTHSVGKAMWVGLFTSGKPFMRTPKCADPARFSQVLRVAWQETVLLALLLAATVSMGFDRGFQDPAVTLWMVMLGVQSVPYAATFATASISALANKKAATAPLAPVAKPVLPKAA